MNQTFNKFLTFLVLILIGSVSFSQKTGTIRGSVLDSKTGEPVMFTNVVVKGTSIGASTDVNGFYQIASAPIGDQILIVTNVQYTAQELSVNIKEGKIATVNFQMEPDAVLDEVEINAEKQESKTNVKVSVIKATKKEIQAVPSVGGEADIATYFQTVPGVVSTGDQGGQMYVRGGSPIQNKVLLDGMVIYNPFHSIGFFSVFDTEIIRNADIYTGGFGAEYGGRISSVMDITSKDGNKKKTDGRVSINPFGAKLTLGGPLKKLSENGGSSISYLLSGKTSYLEQTSKTLYSYVDTAGLPYTYTDLYGKVSINGENGSRFNLFGFNFNDRVTWQQTSQLKWDSYGIGSNFVIIPSGSPVHISGKFNYSNYLISMAKDDVTDTISVINPDSSSVAGFSGGFDFKYFLKGENEIKYGISLEGFATDYTFYNSANRQISQNQNTTEISSYIDLKFIINSRLIINPGFRAHYYTSLGNFSPEPRIGAKYNVNENFRLKLASGMYSQNLISANSDRDVVNLFYGYLSGSDNLQSQFTKENGNVKNVNHKLQKATHLILGGEYDLGKHSSINFEGYVKWFTQLTNTNRNKIYDDNSDSDVPDVLKKDFIVETGIARGFDAVYKYSTERTYIWFVYSLGKVNRWDGIQNYAPIFDRRHNINFIATYFLDKDKKWEVNTRWNFGSGLPFTQTQGFGNALDFSGGLGTDITTANSDNLGIFYADFNKGRLPSYHRLDITFKKHVEFRNKTKMEITASVTNAYSRQNIFYVDRISAEKVYQLPILPSLGINWQF